MADYSNWERDKLENLIAQYRKEIDTTNDYMLKQQLAMTLRHMEIEIEKREAARKN